MILSVVLICCLVTFVTANVWFHETFDDSWADRWVVSKHKEKEGTAGEWTHTAGKFFNDAEKDKGLKTSTDARFYQISAKMNDHSSNKGKDFIVSYIVKHEQNIDCGGGYLKVMPGPVDQSDFNGDTNYNIMFGPDICGSSTKRVHVIFNYKGKNHLIKKDIRCEDDELSHLYTLIVSPDNSYKVLIDNKEKASGKLSDDWDMLPAKEIKDPQVGKPADWVDSAKIADPEAKKPEGWDDIAKEIDDPDASKPDDWSDELDGEWEAPRIPNPEYKGEWKADMIDNPAYKGPWIHPMIANPDYFEDENLYAYESNAYVGIEIWQVKAGTIFDDILVTDDHSELKKQAESFEERSKGEKAAKAALDEEERKHREEEEKKRAEEAPEEEEAEAEEEEVEEELEEEDAHAGHDHEHEDL